METKAQNSKNKTQKGITLIALVITIIVLLILAGVAISMAINSDGLFGKANEAAEGWNESVKEEQTAIGELLTNLDKVSPTPVSISEALPEGWETSKISAVAQGLGGKAPIPVGFVASEIAGENTIGNGLVIYQVDKTTAEGEGFWTNKGEDGYLTCQTGYNQYVWIPVADINQMVMCKSNTANSVCNLKLVGGTLKCTVHTTTATELCGRLYYSASTTTDTAAPKTYTKSMNFANRSQTWEAAGRREPDILEGTDTDSTTGNLSTFTTNMTDDFKNMATSVAKYGGFYVGRYEAGAAGTSKKNQKVLVAGTNGIDTYDGADTNAVVDGGTWYGLYNTLRDITPVGVASHMLYGSQYDQVINFIGTEAQTGHITRQLATQELTGENELDVMNNIYDLEGNNIHWTAEAYTTVADVTRVTRGGVFVNVAGGGRFDPAAGSGYYRPTGDLCYFCTRGALYVK